jgi:IS1 family transposase
MEFCGGQVPSALALAFHFGARKYENLDELLALLEPFDIKIVYSDNNFAYQPRVAGSEVITGKENTCH